MMHVDRLGYGNSGLFSNYNSCGNVAFEHMCKVNFYFLPTVLGIFLKKNGPTPTSFLFIFGLFKQTSSQFLQPIYVKIVHPV